MRTGILARTKVEHGMGSGSIQWCANGGEHDPPRAQTMRCLAPKMSDLLRCWLAVQSIEYDPPKKSAASQPERAWFDGPV